MHNMGSVSPGGSQGRGRPAEPSGSQCAFSVAFPDTQSDTTPHLLHGSLHLPQQLVCRYLRERKLLSSGMDPWTQPSCRGGWSASPWILYGELRWL